MQINFKKITDLMTSATLLTCLLLSQFLPFHQEIAPPIVDGRLLHAITTGFSILLLLIIIAKYRFTQTIKNKKSWLKISIFFAALSILFLIFLLFLSEKYTYYYPPLELNQESSKKFINGDLHEFGEILSKDQSVSMAVYASGGPFFVSNNQILWKKSSEKKNAAILTLNYFAFVFSYIISINILLILICDLTKGKLRRGQ